MSTSQEYIQFVLDQLAGMNGVTCRKMFGEYLVYVQERPVLLVCDNCVMVKKICGGPRIAGGCCRDSGQGNAASPKEAAEARKSGKSGWYDRLMGLMGGLDLNAPTRL